MTDQPFSLDLFRMGYFILFRNDNSLFGNAIAKRQLLAGIDPDCAGYTHIEVSGGGEYAVNISPPISKLVKITERHRGRYIRIMRYRNEEYEAGKRYKVAYFSATLCNKGYDIGGILAFVIKWIKQNNRLYFCSEGALWALQMVFPKALWMEPEETMPGHFGNPDWLEKVWEGEIPNGK